MVAVSSTTTNGYHWAATTAPFFIILSSFLAPYLVSRRYGFMYSSNLLMNQSPRAFVRVPVLTRVNDSDTFILRMMRENLQILVWSRWRFQVDHTEDGRMRVKRWI